MPLSPALPRVRRGGVPGRFPGWPSSVSVMISSPVERPAGLTRASAFGDQRPQREWLGGRCHHLWTQRNSDPCGLSAGWGLCSSPGGRTLNNCEGVGRPAGKSPCFHVNVPAPQTLSGERTLLCVQRKFKAIKLETVSTEGRKADRAEARGDRRLCVWRAQAVRRDRLLLCTRGFAVALLLAVCRSRVCLSHVPVRACVTPTPCVHVAWCVCVRRLAGFILAHSEPARVLPPLCAPRMGASGLDPLVPGPCLAPLVREPRAAVTFSICRCSRP